MIGQEIHLKCCPSVHLISHFLGVDFLFKIFWDPSSLVFFLLALSLPFFLPLLTSSLTSSTSPWSSTPLSSLYPADLATDFWISFNMLPIEYRGVPSMSLLMFMRRFKHEQAHRWIPSALYGEHIE